MQQIIKIDFSDVHSALVQCGTIPQDSTLDIVWQVNTSAFVVLLFLGCLVLLIAIVSSYD